MDIQKVYNILCDEILMQIDNYTCQYNKKPNNIILGKNVEDILKRERIFLIHANKNETYTMFGINVTVDYNNVKIIKVGYMESVSLDAIRCLEKAEGVE